MAIPTELGVNFTPAEIDSLKAAAKTITDLVRSKKTINLSNDERQNKLSTISDERLPYVHRSISNYAVAYPNLNGLAYPLASAAEDFNTFDGLGQVLTAIEEAREVTTEMRMVAGHFCFKFMNDQYYNAKRYLGDNVDGAQLVYDGLKECFEGQGPQADDEEEDSNRNTGDATGDGPSAPGTPNT